MLCLQAGTPARPSQPSVAGVSSSSLSSSEASSSISEYIRVHYDPGRCVVLHMELSGIRYLKAATAITWIVELVGLAFLITALVLKIHKDQHWWFTHDFLWDTNIVTAGICLAALIGSGSALMARTVQVNRAGKAWTPERKRIVVWAMLELLLTTLNVSFYLAANIYVAAGDCEWFDAFIYVMGMLQWTCWNATFASYLSHAHDTNPWRHYQGMHGIREDWTVDLLACTYHTCKFAIWGAVEGIIIAICVLGIHGQVVGFKHLNDHQCHTRRDIRCHLRPAVIPLYVLVIVAFLGYIALAIFFMFRTFQRLKQKPYVANRTAHINLHLQARSRGIAMIFWIFCIIVFLCVGPGTCVSYMQTWLGWEPMILVLTGVTAADAYLATPASTKEADDVLEVWLQEFAWAEQDIPKVKDERRGSLQSIGSKADVDDEPLFCFETALKTLYWSILVYRYQEADPQGVTLEIAMQLYQLTNFELLWERRLDTKAMIAWNEETVVLSFRGTATFNNVLADLSAWYAAHPPKRGIPMISRPYVHQGFLKCWLASGLRDKVSTRMAEITSSRQCADKDLTVIVTGHSLGGAIAMLAALDVRRSCDRIARHNLWCYTFGAPRPGNRPFKWEYDDAVPETWQVINDQDPIPRVNRFPAYRRPGKKVIINAKGDLIVRPGFLETALLRRPGGVPEHHFLRNYQRSMAAVLCGQLHGKRLHGGLMGLLEIAEDTGMGEALQAAGLDVEKLKREVQEKLARRRRREGMPAEAQAADEAEEAAEEAEAQLTDDEATQAAEAEPATPDAGQGEAADEAGTAGGRPPQPERPRPQPPASITSSTTVPGAERRLHHHAGRLTRSGKAHFTHLNDEAIQHEDSGHEEGNAERAEQPAADAQLCRSEATGDRAKRRHMLFGHRFRERQDV